MNDLMHVSLKQIQILMTFDTHTHIYIYLEICY
jgi:hypothetical protein